MPTSLTGAIRWSALALALALWSWSSPTFSQTPPEQLVRKLAVEVTDAVRKSPAGASDALRYNEIVTRSLVPRFDFERITQIAMGRNWARADAGQKRRIVDEFSRLLVRTYANALSTLNESTIEVKGTRSNGSDSDVTVRTQMVGGRSPVSIDYNLHSGGGGWKVYDVTVEGVSLVSAYRDEFTQLVSNGGVDGLISALQRKNGR
jgi:phospholipid transport system substrate-binding protein